MYNDINLDEILGNVIYTDSPQITVDSYKTFGTANFEEGIHISSGLLNDIEIKNYVTKSTEQTLGLSEIYGDVFFHKLELGGLYDFVNVTELDLNSIKTFGDQYTEAEIVINGELVANKMRIEHTLNQHPIEHFYRTDQDIQLHGEVNFKDLMVNDAHIYGDIHTSGYLNGVSLEEFDKKRLSITRPQVIPACHIEHATILGNLKNDIVNHHPTASFTNNILKSQSVRNLLYSGEIIIDNLYVNKNVAIKTVNGIDLNQLSENAVWLNKPNTIYADVKFSGPVHVQGDVSFKGLLNDKYFDDFVNDLVLKNQDVIEIKGVKAFVNGFHVTGNIDTKNINNIPVENIVRKDGSVPIEGQLIVYGEVSTDSLSISGSLNNMTIKDLQSQYEYDEETDTHLLKSDVTFSKPIHIKDLYVKGQFNSKPNINDYIKTIIRTEGDFNITGTKTFLQTVYFNQGFEVEEFNDIPFTIFLNEIVLNHPTGSNTIEGLVSFTEPVFAPNINVHGDLATHNIADCSPQEMAHNALMVNQHEKILSKCTFYVY